MKIRFIQLMDMDLQSNVSKYDLTEEMKINGWQLPSIDEMSMIFNEQSRNTNINLEKKWYHINQDSDGKNPFDSNLPVGFYQYQFNFSNGEHGWRDCTEDHWGLANVRLLRSEIPIKYLVHNGETISNLILQACDMGEMNWNEAQSQISKLGDGWRLPTIKEFELIYGASEFCKKEIDFNLSANKNYLTNDKRIDATENLVSAIHISIYDSDSMSGYVENFDKSEKLMVKAIKSI